MNFDKSENIESAILQRDFKIIDSENINAIKYLLEESTNIKVFEYAIDNIKILRDTIWAYLLRMAPGSLVKRAVEKFRKESSSNTVFEVLYNPEIYAQDFDYVLGLAKSKNAALDYIFASIPTNISTRTALKLSEIARLKDIENIGLYYGLFALRVFCIRRRIEQKSNAGEEEKYYIENYAASDMETWAEKYQPSIADFLFVAATLFLCTKSLGIIGIKPNILLTIK